MTTVHRRTFLIGLSAALAAPALARINPAFTGEISTGILNSALKRRRIVDVMFSCMPTGEEIRGMVEDPVRFTFFRDNDALLAVTLNPRASYRWVAAPGSELEFLEQHVLRVEVEPCYTWTTINLMSDIELDRTRRPKMVSEVFRWKNGIADLDSINVCNMQDEKELATLSWEREKTRFAAARAGKTEVGGMPMTDEFNMAGDIASLTEELDALVQKNEQLEAEIEHQQADINKLLAERQGWLEEIERLEKELELANTPPEDRR